MRPSLYPQPRARAMPHPQPEPGIFPLPHRFYSTGNDSSNRTTNDQSNFKEGRETLHEKQKEEQSLSVDDILKRGLGGAGSEIPTGNSFFYTIFCRLLLLTDYSLLDDEVEVEHSLQTGSVEYTQEDFRLLHVYRTIFCSYA